MNCRELLIQSLDALEMPCDRWNKRQRMIVMKAADALRAALAKPEPEPVAWANTSHNFAGKYTTFVVAYHKSTGWDVPLYLREDL